MKTLSNMNAVRLTTYLVVLILFATGCNWVGTMIPFSVSDESAAEDTSIEDSATSNAVQSDGDQSDAPPSINENTEESLGGDASTAPLTANSGNTSEESALSVETVVAATAEAIVNQLKEVNASTDAEAKATADAIVNQLIEVSEGLQNRRAAVFHQGVIQDDLVNVRSGPDTGYAILTQVEAGQTLNITGRNETSDWLQVCCPAEGEEEGWILASLLVVPDALIDSLSTVPVVEAPALPIAASNAPPANGAAAGLPPNGGYSMPTGVNPLTGLAMSADRSNQRPVVVCINNDVVARPQFGTSQADVMYEYLMEGYGITRFSGVFFGSDVNQIGPIRSARLINVYLEALYDAGLACSGASDPVRYTLKHESPYPYMDVDLDDPSNLRYSASVGSDYRTRLRTSTAQLRQFMLDWGAQRAGSIRGFTFGAPAAGGRPATSINIPYPGVNRSAYQYDGGSGLYLRSLGGTPHLDGNSGAQLALDNVIVQYIPHETTNIVEDSLGSLSIRLNLFGSGRALVFRDGQIFEGIWRSDNGGDMPRFYAIDGSEIPLKPGRSWISVVPGNYTISFQ